MIDEIFDNPYDDLRRKFRITFKNWDGIELQVLEVSSGLYPSYTGPTPTKPSDSTHDFAFSGWDEEIDAANEDKTYTAQFTSDKYMVIFKNWDGSTLKSDSVLKGQYPTPPSSIPPKPGTSIYKYTFSGWSPELKPVEEDIIYTAMFVEGLQLHGITFDTHGGNPINPIVQEVGTAIAPPPSPTKTGYTFLNWSPAIPTTMPDHDITCEAVWEVNKYQITFKNSDEILQESMVNYGTVPEYTGTTPTRPSTSPSISYEFAGWFPTLSEVEGSIVYTATFKTVKRKYTITFKNSDGTELQKEQVEFGQMPAYHGTTPVKESTAQYGYNFASWFPEVGVVTGDMTYTATYSSYIRKYTIKWLNYDGSKLDEQLVEYGTIPETSVVPTKPGDKHYTYAFNKWFPNVIAVTEEDNYIATFTSDPVIYTLYFETGEGSIVDPITKGYGTTVTPPADPTREGYTFKGWFPSLPTTMPDEDRTYYAKWEEIIIEWNIEFVDVDDTRLQESTVRDGYMPSYDNYALPIAGYEESSNENERIVFNQWSPDIQKAVQNEIYHATYDVSEIGTWLLPDGSTTVDAETAIMAGNIPIGICVIPSGVIDSKARYLSVVNMSTYTPKKGAPAGEHSDLVVMPWGEEENSNNLDKLYGRAEYPMALRYEEEEGDYKLIPELEDGSVAQKFAVDYELYPTKCIKGISGLKWYSVRLDEQPNDCIPEASRSDDSIEMSLFRKQKMFSNSRSGNIIQLGSEVTNSCAQLQESYAESDYINIDRGYGNYFPAAMSCVFFDPQEKGTQGQWYLPSLGEMIYAMSNIHFINRKLVNVYKSHSDLVTPLGMDIEINGEDITDSSIFAKTYWTSSIFDREHIWYIDLSNNSIKIDSNFQDNQHNTRAFIAV